MKRNLLIPIGLIIILIAIINSLSDFKLFSLDKTKDGQSKSSTSHSIFESRNSYISKDEYKSLNLDEIKDPQLENTNSPQINEVEVANLKDEIGFVPLQLEKQESGIKNNEEKITRAIPLELIINSIQLDAPIVPAARNEIIQNGITYSQWSAPDNFAAGWQFDSAHLGEIGNTVLNGHHNVFGEVFKNLNLIMEGDKVILNGDDGKKYTYLVTNVMILPERDVSIDQRLDNAKWMMPSTDERLTLITCWPSYSNTHRLIVVAKPESSVFIKQLPEK